MSTRQDTRGSDPSRRSLRLGGLLGALGVAWALAACSFPLDAPPGSGGRSLQEQQRESNRLFLEEQARISRERLLFGPSTTSSER